MSHRTPRWMHGTAIARPEAGSDETDTHGYVCIHQLPHNAAYGPRRFLGTMFLAR